MVGAVNPGAQVAALVVRLSSDVSSELSWTGDDDIVADYLINVKVPPPDTRC